MHDMFRMVRSNTSYAGLLESAQICRDLFALGVPRWVVEYLTLVKNNCRDEGIPRLTTIKDCCDAIWSKYVANYFTGLTTEHRIRLAGSAIAGQPCDLSETFDGDIKWSKLRDSSLCLLTPQAPGLDVHVPYVLLQNVGSIRAKITTAAERAFVESLNDLKEYVDDTMFVSQAWQSWVMFGACFYAVRINALLVLGHTTVPLKLLLPGALMNTEMESISVKLVPSRVFQCASTFGASTPRFISERGNEEHRIDWTSSGCIVVNGDGGAGIDILFALEDATTPGKMVVFVDQRKRHLVKCQPSRAKECLGKIPDIPTFLKDGGACLVRGVMSCVAMPNIAEFVVPSNCFLMIRDETDAFHGTLKYHPACSSIIPVNSASKTVLKTVLVGDQKEVEEVADEIVKRRVCSSDELTSFVETKRLKVEVVAS